MRVIRCDLCSVEIADGETFHNVIAQTDSYRRLIANRSKDEPEKENVYRYNDLCVYCYQTKLAAILAHGYQHIEITEQVQHLSPPVEKVV